VFGRADDRRVRATADPMVLAWSHIYLGRIFDDEGNRTWPRRSISRVGRGRRPDQAKLAAQKGLAAFGGDKSLRGHEARIDLGLKEEFQRQRG